MYDCSPHSTVRVRVPGVLFSHCTPFGKLFWKGGVPPKFAGDAITLVTMLVQYQQHSNANDNANANAREGSRTYSSRYMYTVRTRVLGYVRVLPVVVYFVAHATPFPFTDVFITGNKNNTGILLRETAASSLQYSSCYCIQYRYYRYTLPVWCPYGISGTNTFFLFLEQKKRLTKKFKPTRSLETIIAIQYTKGWYKIGPIK